MLATIELPNNKIELAFILEVLKRLNVSIVETNEKPLETEIVNEHAAILRDRRTAMSAADAQFFTWEEAQAILDKRNTGKSSQ